MAGVMAVAFVVAADLDASPARSHRSWTRARRDRPWRALASAQPRWYVDARWVAGLALACALAALSCLALPLSASAAGGGTGLPPSA